MAVTVRAARASDVDALVRGTMGNAFESEQIRLDQAVVRRGVAALLADPNKGKAFVAEDAGAVVGSLYVTREWSDWHEAWYWWIQSLFVAPTHRGTGVYSAIYQHVKTTARKEKVRSIRLYVESHNEAALRAYRGHGMKETDYRVFEQVL